MEMCLHWWSFQRILNIPLPRFLSVWMPTPLPLHRSPTGCSNTKFPDSLCNRNGRNTAQKCSTVSLPLGIFFFFFLAYWHFRKGKRSSFLTVCGFLPLLRHGMNITSCARWHVERTIVNRAGYRCDFGQSVILSLWNGKHFWTPRSSMLSGMLTV